MKVQEIMERVGMTETGRAIAYIKDGLEEIEIYAKENISRGGLARTTGTGISFMEANEEFATTVTQFIGAATSFSETAPTGWTAYESVAIDNPQFARDTSSASGTSGYFLSIRPKANLNPSKTCGMYREITGLTIGVPYTFTYTANTETFDSTSFYYAVAI